MEILECKIASLSEIAVKYDYEIAQHEEDKENWVIWKKQTLKNCKQGYRIIYHGVIRGSIVCEASAILNPDIVQNNQDIIDEEIVYLCAFRTLKEYENQGYFSKLFDFMIEDLKCKGYKAVTLGVEPDELRNKEIYMHLGFTQYIKSGIEIYPDGTMIKVEYYKKLLV